MTRTSFVSRLTLGTAAATLFLVSQPFVTGNESFAKSGKNKLEIYMTSTGIDPDATGKASLFLNANRDRFELTLKNLPLGSYDFSVNGVLSGVVSVTNDESGGTQGKLKFDPKKGGALPFDPKGATLTVSQGATTFLTTSFPTSADQIADVQFGIDLVSSGLVSGAEGDAEFKVRNGRMDFSVEVEKVPTADYQLFVDGALVGTIHAAPRPGSTKVRGEIEFSSNTDDQGEIMLTFDPRGKSVEVKDAGGLVVLSVTFPAAPPAI